ncbi:hypothetical protein ACFO9Q_17175 [Paenibacillus sp. GCM10023252]|uniref:hypothetical protein n=1 Tax=Paenibacillus sp. GCM10023252 TaxID=3252649 RepID=UPI00360FFE65
MDENKGLDTSEMKKWCSDHMHRYVLAHTKDGWCCDGIIEHMDDEYICLAVPSGGEMMQDRALLPFGPFGGGFGGYGGGFGGYGGYGYPPLYPYPYYPRRRFGRRVFPLAGLLGLSLLPYY